jgi:hypothetical protein
VENTFGREAMRFEAVGFELEQIRRYIREQEGGDQEGLFYTLRGIK